MALSMVPFKFQIVNRVVNTNIVFSRSFADAKAKVASSYNPPYVIEKRTIPLQPRLQFNKYLQVKILFS
jgi:hypothetical protein